MHHIKTNSYVIEVGELADSSFNTLLTEEFAESRKVILVDDNTHENCLGYLIGQFDALSTAEIVVLPAGESSKNMDIAYGVWETFTEYEIGRNDLIINVGGGVITDMGGFIASCYKRGCSFINIPTTLLGMVDASIGGKTGINLGNYKNQIGLFSNPEAIYIDLAFLESLPEEEVLNGFAEMLKHGLIYSEELYNEIMESISSSAFPSEELLVKCIEVKNKVVIEDPLEAGLRKILNFGHTIGHVLEGHYLGGEAMGHGHCVAVGMVMEALISVKLGMLTKDEFDKIESDILGIYSLPKYSNQDIKEMIGMLTNDKKNRNGKVLCSLIDKIGSCQYDVEVTQEIFLETFLHFENEQLNMN